MKIERKKYGYIKCTIEKTGCSFGTQSVEANLLFEILNTLKSIDQKLPPVDSAMVRDYSHCG